MSLDKDNVNNSLIGIKEPEDKLKALSKLGNMLNFDINIPLIRYYRSGKEMNRTAKMYLSEGHVENAYILYIRFMTLFIEKVQLHPEYKSFPSAQKNQMVSTIRQEVMPLTEKLKAKILDRYQREYKTFLAQKEAERVRERAKQKERDTGGGTSGVGSVSIKSDPFNQPTAPDLSLLDRVVYPNDFPSGTNKSALPNSGLLLPDKLPTPEIKKPIPQKKPTFDRSQKPTAHDQKTSESLIEGAFRTVIIPLETMNKFLNIASRNTNQNVETCGILAGCVASNQLKITHIIIPKQHGTADSCATMQEEELFDIQDQLNLITLGWIHTHPSQTAFLSSVDLHTHFSYQIMMKEAIAIVCAPKYKETGFFCLTPHYGLDYIAQCRQQGFHPHPKDPPLFMEADHISIEEKAKVEVVDLRNR